MKKPIVLMILDGWGLTDITEGNAVHTGHTPVMDQLQSDNPTSSLKASGKAVGLPEGYMGNSEVGHLTIGSGRVIWQMLERINHAISKGTFEQNEGLQNLFSICKKHGSSFHITGLLSDKGVHAHIDHLFAVLDAAARENVTVYVHAITDGRDTMPRVAKSYLKQLEEKMSKSTGILATINGRYYAMDRDKRWDRTQKAFDAIVHAKGETATSYEEVVDEAYAQDKGDEFILPTVIGEYRGIKENDVVLFYNYRFDRGRQLSAALTEEEFGGFDRKKPQITLGTFVRYYKELNAIVLFEKEKLKNILGEVLSRNGLKQLRVAETEKYAHVTYFFNGEVEQPYEGEDRLIVASPKVATYDLQPDMSADEITAAVVNNVDKYDVIVVNFANGDMVGHTGVFDAAVKAVEKVDSCVKKVVEAVSLAGGITLITADHGNCEEMLNEKGEVLTAHSTNLVPFVVIGKDCIVADGSLADIAPTILNILEIEKPEEMTGNSLIQ